MLKRLHMFCSKRSKKGFTLIELLIVVAIIAILAAIAIPQFAAYRRKGYNTAANSDLRNIRTMEESMFADFQDYGSAAVGSGTITLTGGQTSTVAQPAQLSTGVFAGVNTNPGGGFKNNTFTAGSYHGAGDTVYGVDSDVSTVFRHPCVAAGACVSSDLSVPTANASTTPDFVAPWLQM
jgi:prepilin-type N-terminal cleavage/methylation domain-containing protein